jgi:hypothetical protein
MIKTPSLQTHKSSIPSEILEKVQVIVTKPDFADLRADLIAVTLRMRTNGLEAEECKRLQVTEITADIVQKEKYALVYFSPWLLSCESSRPVVHQISPLQGLPEHVPCSSQGKTAAE